MIDSFFPKVKSLNEMPEGYSMTGQVSFHFPSTNKKKSVEDDSYEDGKRTNLSKVYAALGKIHSMAPKPSVGPVRRGYKKGTTVFDSFFI